MRPARTQISLRIRAVCSESLLITRTFYSIQASEKGIIENLWHTGCTLYLGLCWSHRSHCKFCHTLAHRVKTLIGLCSFAVWFWSLLLSFSLCMVSLGDLDVSLFHGKELIWAVKREKGSFSFPWNQSFSAHSGSLSEAISLILWSTFPLFLRGMVLARMRRVAWTPAVRICYNGSFPMTWHIPKRIVLQPHDLIPVSRWLAVPRSQDHVTDT